MRQRSALIAVLGLAAAGCVRQTRADAASPGQVIDARELARVGPVSALEAIQRLRRDFLSSRGETSLNATRSQSTPTVFVDGAEYGSVAELRAIPASQLAEIRLYRAWEATTKFGTGYLGGVIALSTKR